MTRLYSYMMFIVCISFSVCMGSEIGVDIITDGVGATITGEVIEASPEQKPIEGVTVKIVNAGDGQEYIVTTDENGYYEKLDYKQVVI